MLSKQKTRIFFLAIMILMGGIIVLFYLALYGNSNQIYNDIIVENTSIFSSNKSAEINLLFGLIFAGISIYTIFFFVSEKKQNLQKEKNIYFITPSNSKSKEFLCVLIVSSVIYMLIFGNSYQIIIASLLYASILFVIDQDLLHPGICTFYLTTYASIGIYRMYVFNGGQNSINSMVIAATSFLFSLVPFAFTHKKNAIIRFGMLQNLIIPLTLFIYLSDKYMTGSGCVSISAPNALKIVIWILIALFIVEAVYILIKKWKIAESIDDVITIGSCITIMAFNRFDGTGAIMSSDMHHPFENIIGFSQIFQLGQKLFKEYIPVSGMYSIIQGFIFNLFGDSGTFANYFITNNLFYLFIIILIVILLRAHITGSYVLLLSMIFYFQSYNRSAFMLPIMLLLAWPKLIEKKNAWLMIWFLSSLFQGLYYPLYGVATCVAFMPLGIWQVISFVKEGQLKKETKTLSFWGGWLICIILLLLCIMYLLGTLRHMLAMSGQSILADGLSRFGQSVPGWFLPYLGDTYLTMRIAIYYILTWMVPVSLVWIAFALSLEIAEISFDTRIKIGNMKNLCLLTAAVIMPIICYTYTFIRLDVDAIYARSASALFTGVILILVFTWTYVRSEALRLLLIVGMVSIPAAVNTEGIFAIEANSKLSPYYTVPDGYIYLENDVIEKLGTGFIEKNRYDDIKNIYTNFKEKDRSLSYMGGPSQFGYFYLLDIKGDGVMEIAPTVKGLSATEETIDIARMNKSIISPSFTPYYNYYLYHWLVASGEYVWDPENREFLPNTGLFTHSEIIEQNKNIDISWNDMDLGKTAASWGASMASLEGLFSEPGVTYNKRVEQNSIIIDFQEPFDGNNADFIYLEFGGMEENYEYTLYNSSGEISQKDIYLGKYLMKKNYNPEMIVQIGWKDHNGEIHTMKCKMSKGKLLIPLGAGAKWLFNQHSYISISVFQNENQVTVPELLDVRMLKLREAN